MSTVKSELHALIRQLPDDSSIEDIVRELTFHVMVCRGAADADAGDVIAHDEMKAKIRAWQR
ncbi:MAG: hypothetical protein AAF545_14100 [Pseudomonadota bacterium]|mgnify:CR=1 FL=1